MLQIQDLDQEPRSYHDLLEAIYSLRSQRNPRYSLSAFARDLDISVARLSAILLKKRGLSPIAAQKIAKNLNLDESQASLFMDMVESLHARSSTQRKIAQSRLASKLSLKIHHVQVDAFRIVADWYHFSILELTTVEGFEKDPDWIAKRIGISKQQATDAIERLFRVGVLREAGQKWEPVEKFISGPDGVPSDAALKFHQQMLQKAALALQTQKMETRDIGAATLSFNVNDLPEAKKLLREFRQKFAKHFRARLGRNSLYALTLQFFRIDNDEN